MKIDKKRERVRWACRRGMLECDLIFVPFFEEYYDQLTDVDKVIFEQLLAESDAELIAWLMGPERPRNADYEPIIEKIRQTRNISFIT